MIYLNLSEYRSYSGDTTTSDSNVEKYINMSAGIVDAYVGRQDKFYTAEFVGICRSGGTGTFGLQNDHSFDEGYLIYCTVEIIGGTGKGRRSVCTANTRAGVVTLEDSIVLDTTSVYRINQYYKFPRKKDTSVVTQGGYNVWYKSIPEEIKLAMSSQVQYIAEMGVEFFNTDKSQKRSEHIGNYSYWNVDTGQVDSLISPSVKVLLSGIRNRTGVIII